MHHGFIGALGGAYAGHKLEDYVKEEKKKKKANKLGHGGSSSSSSSSSDEGKHKIQQQASSARMRGNFSGSSNQISLDRDFDLIASCSAVDGSHRLSSIKLNDYITNDNGHFRWVNSGGNFAASAKNVHLENSGKVLVAELCTVDGHWRQDGIWLDERITNNDGDLNYVH